MTNLDLYSRWEKLCGRLDVPVGVRHYYNEVAKKYAETSRHFHVLGHVEYRLVEFNRASRLARCPDAVELALWLDNTICDQRFDDNEEQSALYARKLLARMGVRDEIRLLTPELIRSTFEHKETDSIDGQIVIDVDLAIFGQPKELFDRYEELLQMEFRHIPSREYRRRRQATLRSFLQRPRIYQTAPFFRLYEDLARDNLARSVEKLAA